MGKSAQKNPPGKSPGKSSKIYTTKILQHISADWPGQHLLFIVFFHIPKPKMCQCGDASGKLLIPRFCWADLLRWHVCSLRVNFARKIFCWAANFLRKNAPKFVWFFFEPLFCGSAKKIPQNSRQISLRISLRKIQRNSLTSFCRSAGRRICVEVFCFGLANSENSRAIFSANSSEYFSREFLGLVSPAF